MTPSSHLSATPLTRRLASFLTFSRLIIISSILRITLIAYSEWHDAHSVVKYTDVDYRVFSDATRFLLDYSATNVDENVNVAKGILGQQLGVGDPYRRATYRYTPLLAVLLAPNEWIHPAFGKFLFAACDIGAGLLIYRMLIRFVLPYAQDTRSTPSKGKGSVKPATDTRLPVATLAGHATLLTATHLLNPLVFSISTRGSSESVLSLFVLASLYCALDARWDAAAVMLGLATHWKIYPFIYGFACLGVIGGSTGHAAWVGRMVNLRTVRFACVSLATFVALGGMMYLVWGYPFLYNAYLYHLHRLDHRHNFSPYFYLIYLTYPMPSSSTAGLSIWQQILRSPLASFVPQMTLSLGAGFLFGRHKHDLPFAWFVQTFAFVIFNKFTYAIGWHY
ncbi:hypothetical protein NM688_g5801 [Phlebia brevispora]|uniref:Uncharacterized protein n=1 Tax=Phlebia brevispora TaxID=194682 RepID=A0ACC1SPN0_9APHY|nr:hypothetical protein NM688_g5801 [Phlebia brevispora]